jgi:hypothetical protein
MDRAKAAIRNADDEGLEAVLSVVATALAGHLARERHPALYESLDVSERYEALRDVVHSERDRIPQRPHRIVAAAVEMYKLWFGHMPKPNELTQLVSEAAEISTDEADLIVTGCYRSTLFHREWVRIVDLPATGMEKLAEEIRREGD